MNFLNKKLRFHGQSWWEENQQNKSPTNGLDQKELSLHHSDKYKKLDYPKAKLCHLLHPKKRKFQRFLQMERDNVVDRMLTLSN